MAVRGVLLSREREGLRGFASLQGKEAALNGAISVPVDLPESGYPVVVEDVSAALTGLLRLAMPGDYSRLTQSVIDLLGLLKETFSELTWRNAVLPAARAHTLAGLIHECPFTHHSFVRPRGYPGDAGLLDFVYRHPATRPAQEAASEAGRTVMASTIDVTACEAVRLRRSVLAGKIDDTASLRDRPRILAVACGHLREAELSVALKEGRIGRLLATDQDEISLATVDCYRQSLSDAIETSSVTVRTILTGKADLGRFDLIYAAGLYDYLDARVAARLTRVLFDQLDPGGRLLIPNFLWGVPEEAYMEVYMDWYLLYRTRDEIEGFAAELSPACVGRTTYSEDGAGVIGYLEIERV
ncbi:methyltransferase type 12 [Methylobacterium sp. D53M]|jgi:extracellular factor (EF) 3-hydroxypalmitic acid methyl ester biosynthesis protein